MMRIFACAGIALVLSSGVVWADKGDKTKPANTAVGKIKKVDAAAGTLTVTTSVKTAKGQPPESKDVEFKLGDTAKVILVSDGANKQELTAKEGLKNAQVKEGVTVAIVSDKDGKVVEARIGAPDKTKGTDPASKPVTGKIKKVDASTGALTVTTSVAKGKGQPPEIKDVEFKVGETAKVLLFTGEKKQGLSAKEGLKNEQVKEGATVAVVSDKDGKVVEVRVGLPEKKAEGPAGRSVSGTFKNIDATTGAFTATVKVPVTKGQPPEVKDVEYKSDAATKFIVLVGQEQKEVTGKDGLKVEQAKVGAPVTVVTDKQDKVLEVRIGFQPGKKKIK